MRILSQLVVTGLSLFVISAAADKPMPLGPAASGGGGLLTPDGAVEDPAAPVATPPPTKTKPSEVERRRALIDLALKSPSKMVQDHLKAGIKDVGGEEFLVEKKKGEWFNALRAKLGVAKTSKKAAEVDPSLADPVATGGLAADPDKDSATCLNCKPDKDGQPLREEQRRPLEDLSNRLPPPPPPAPIVPVVPAPQPNFLGINNDMLLGGMFGLFGGVLLSSIMNKRQNQQRPFFPSRGRPMPVLMRRGGGFPGGYGGGYGGRPPAPGIAGQPGYGGGYGGYGGYGGGSYGYGGSPIGGGLGAPAVLPAIYQAPQYSVYGGNNVGVNSVGAFGSMPVSTSPILGGTLGGGAGAPGVIRPY